MMEETAHNPELLFKEVNLEGTQNLALQAGVQRLIYITTIKVNGECADTVKCPETVNIPNDAYAASKWLAEQALLEVAEETGLEVVIIRPPLVYGPGVKGNFLRLLKLIQKNIPIPLGAVANKRNMVYVANSCHLIKQCINHPKAAGEIFLVSDNSDLSTPELIRLIAAELNQSEKLLSIPLSWITACARVLGKEAERQRLCGSLQVYIDKTKQLLSWHPPFSVQQGVRETAQWFFLNQVRN
jgi:UDP-glucose 4-epimerase